MTFSPFAGRSNPAAKQAASDFVSGDNYLVQVTAAGYGHSPARCQILVSTFSDRSRKLRIRKLCGGARFAILGHETLFITNSSITYIV
jgi:hypothetical protein